MNANGVLVFKKSIYKLDVYCSVNFMLVPAS